MDRATETWLRRASQYTRRRATSVPARNRASAARTTTSGTSTKDVTPVSSPPTTVSRRATAKRWNRDDQEANRDLSPPQPFRNE